MHLIPPAIGLCFGFVPRWWLVGSKLAKRLDVQTQASIVKGWKTTEDLGKTNKGSKNFLFTVDSFEQQKKIILTFNTPKLFL
jgi:hypothetical protein